MSTTLAAALAEEDDAELLRELSPLDRITCTVHRRWVHECVASPLHVIVVTGHRWCRACQSPCTVAVDHLTCTVKVRCPVCWRVPVCAATDQIVRTCQASLAAARSAA